MLPKDWGRQGAPLKSFKLPSERAAVEDRYRNFGDSPQLTLVFDEAAKAGADRVFVESPYVDQDYRSDLAHFYGRAFRPPPPETERLLFARGDALVGAAVMRPLPAQVGRTVMSPPDEIGRYISCTARHPINAFGHTHEVEGFPFASQDGEYGVCAHVGMWSIARYHHLRFGTAKYSTAGIIEASRLTERPDRTARSEGMYGQDILTGFRGMGLPALKYELVGLPQGETVDSIMMRYLDSQIPVGILTMNHMMVATGYGVRPGGTVFYFVSDDNAHAYRRIDQIPKKAPDCWAMLLVPMPGRIHVSGEAAEARSQQSFEDRIRANVGPTTLLEAWEKKKIQSRTYACPSTEYVSRLEARSVHPAVAVHHVYAPKSAWLWVTEFHDVDSNAGTVIGEIAIDATSLQLSPSPLFGNIDGWAYIWNEGSEEPRVAEAGVSGASHQSSLPDRGESITA